MEFNQFLSGVIIKQNEDTHYKGLKKFGIDKML